MARLIDRFAVYLRDGSAAPVAELKINFLRPFWTGKLVATGRVVKGGRTIGLAECDVADVEGRLVARAMSTVMTLREGASEGR